MGDFRKFFVGGAVLGAIATSIANLKADTESGEQGGIGAWVISLLILAVIAAIVYFIVARMLREGPARRPSAALVFAVLGVLGLAAFWAGISGVFAGAAAGLALGGTGTIAEGPDITEGRGLGGLGLVAVILAVVVSIALVVFAATG